MPLLPWKAAFQLCLGGLRHIASSPWVRLNSTAAGLTAFRPLTASSMINTPARPTDQATTHARYQAPFLISKSSKMPSAEGAFRVFQGSSAIAATGFITLIVQTLLAKYRKRKSQAKSKTTVALSAVTSGDEPQKPTTAAGGSSEHGKAEPDQAWKKPLHEKIDALISQARS